MSNQGQSGGGRTGYWIPAHDRVGADAGGAFFRRRRRRHWTPWRGFIENVLFQMKKSIFWTHIVFAWNTNFQIWGVLIGLTTEN